MKRFPDFELRTEMFVDVTMYVVPEVLNTMSVIFLAVLVCLGGRGLVSDL